MTALRRGVLAVDRPSWVESSLQCIGPARLEADIPFHRVHRRCPEACFVRGDPVEVLRVHRADGSNPRRFGSLVRGRTRKGKLVSPVDRATQLLDKVPVATHG
jgi:hypothetical protein